MRLLTVGHGTLAAEAFAALLSGAGVETLVDIRRFPASRRHPHFARELMGDWLAPSGVDYRWEPVLGGRRPTSAASPNQGLRDAGFRGYADYMATGDFAAGLERLLGDARAATTAAMCAESLWWRCHRRLVADAAVLLGGAEVLHLLHDGRLQPHQLTEGVVADGGRLLYRPIWSAPG